MHQGQYLKKKPVALEIDIDRGKGKILVTFNFPKSNHSSKLYTAAGKV